VADHNDPDTRMLREAPAEKGPERGVVQGLNTRAAGDDLEIAEIVARRIAAEK